MRFPSIKTIQDRLAVDRDKAKHIRKEMEKVAWAGNVQGRRPYHVLQTIDTILGTHGVEGVMGYTSCYINYCNTGETYETTVIFDYMNDKFIIGSWGDMVEKYEKRFNE